MHQSLRFVADHSDISDSTWATLAPLVTGRPHGPGRPARDHRVVINGILWVLDTGAAWRHAPTDYGPWQTLYGRYARWCNDGTWHRVTEVLRRHQAFGRTVTRTVAMFLFAVLTVFAPHSARTHRTTGTRVTRTATAPTRRR